MVLAWTKELVGGFLSIFGADRESYAVKTCIILWAVLFVYILDFSINVSKYSLRSNLRNSDLGLICL
jgi:solute carrier family 45 protein 1/2/4